MEPKSDGSRTTRMLVIAACFVIVVAGMKAAASILVPCLLAVFIVVIIAPLFLWLKGRGVPDGVAILLMALILAVAGFLGVGILRTSVKGFSDNLSTYQESLSAKTGDLWNRAIEQGILSADETPTKVVKRETVMRYLGTATGTLRNVLTQAFLILLVVILISLIFWGWVLGPVGMLLSVPLTMAVKIALEDGEETRWIALMMGSAASRQVASPADQEAPDRDSGGEASDESA